jgi:hypothetical protein
MTGASSAKNRNHNKKFHVGSLIGGRCRQLCGALPLARTLPVACSAELPLETHNDPATEVPRGRSPLSCAC